MEPYRKTSVILRGSVTWGSLAASTAMICVLNLVPYPVAPDGGLFSAPAAQAQSECCFDARTPVLMWDGSERPIREIRPGDRVIGRGGRVNRVTGIHVVSLGARPLYGINGQDPFFTAEHPFLGQDGWRALDRAATWREMPGLELAEMRTGDSLVVASVAVSSAGQLALAPAVLFGTCILHRLASRPGEPGQHVYNLSLDGDHSYVANGFVVHNKNADSVGGGDGGGKEGNQGVGDGIGGGKEGNRGGGQGTGDQGGASEGGESDPGTTEGEGSTTLVAPPDPEPAVSVAPVTPPAIVIVPVPGGVPGVFNGNATPLGPDLTTTEEQRLIENGWQ